MTVPAVRIRDAERTRAELLDVATAAFAESGFSGTRVDDIAERTRTTKRMIYYYFGGKEQLYLAVLEEAYRGIREAEQTIDVDEYDLKKSLARSYLMHGLREALKRAKQEENRALTTEDAMSEDPSSGSPWAQKRRRAR